MNPWNRYHEELVMDLYELTMAQSFWREGMNGEATFSLFVRDYPPHRGYLVAAGLEPLLSILEDLRFTPEAIEYLDSTRLFAPAFLSHLSGLRLAATVRALPEGTLCFPNQPLLEVTAPILQAQLIETMAINALQLDTLVAGKAARCMEAARGKDLVDFSLRRTHGVDAGVRVARASYLAGFAGTSNVLAGKLYDIPVFGTMAHSYVTSFGSELEAFRSFVREFPEQSVLLIDTYDTLSGARKALEVAREMAAAGRRLRGVRLDSGDLAALSRQVRHIFQNGGFPDIRILASGNLDEFKIEELERNGAAIDVYAVGTRLGVSADAPYLDMVYKLVEYNGRPVLKLSSGKKTWVGAKQVFRHFGSDGCMSEDHLGLASERRAVGQPLLRTVMEGGRRSGAGESLSTIRERFARGYQSLPVSLRELRPGSPYPVKISAPLQRLDEEIVNQRSRAETSPAA